ncbi:unnamed protein product [Protopolystoma xenopodis]|uniref:Uncharacterized protein n=1 Tax=Protopolystoma xenopodis TaxID=117903 RepID=A0A3S5AX57_9PLAT|nr:unnamed protein product [Protopolystoma xenopodis]
MQQLTLLVLSFLPCPVTVDRRHDATCEPGQFELIYKQQFVPTPVYLGTDLRLFGIQIRIPPAPASSISSGSSSSSGCGTYSTMGSTVSSIVDSINADRSTVRSVAIARSSSNKSNTSSSSSSSSNSLSSSILPDGMGCSSALPVKPSGRSETRLTITKEVCPNSIVDTIPRSPIEIRSSGSMKGYANSSTEAAATFTRPGGRNPSARGSAKRSSTTFTRRIKVPTSPLASKEPEGGPDNGFTGSPTRYAARPLGAVASSSWTVMTSALRGSRMSMGSLVDQKYLVAPSIGALKAPGPREKLILKPTSKKAGTDELETPIVGASGGKESRQHDMRIRSVRQSSYKYSFNGWWFLLHFH